MFGLHYTDDKYSTSANSDKATLNEFSKVQYCMYYNYLRRRISVHFRRGRSGCLAQLLLRECDPLLRTLSLFQIKIFDNPHPTSNLTQISNRFYTIL